MIEWRFDQGRLDYFRFDEIKKLQKDYMELINVQSHVQKILIL